MFFSSFSQPLTRKDYILKTIFLVCGTCAMFQVFLSLATVASRVANASECYVFQSEALDDYQIPRSQQTQEVRRLTVVDLPGRPREYTVLELIDHSASSKSPRVGLFKTADLKSVLTRRDCAPEAVTPSEE